MPRVTLTTDFGTADGYVGAMKGVIWSRAPDAVVADLAHDVPRHDIAAGAYALAQAAPYFPDGTIHVAVVDPGVGTERRGVVVSDGRCLFVAPDNGILALAVPDPQAAWAIEAAGFRREPASATFHGRDVFAAAAGALAAGAAPAEAGPAVDLQGALPGPDLDIGETAARVVHVDVFGNLITDYPGDRLPEGARFSVAGRSIGQLSATFADVARGALVAYVGSLGTLEVAVREGRADELLGVGRGDLVAVGRREAG